jgi:hypothetical protein
VKPPAELGTTRVANSLARKFGIGDTADATATTTSAPPPPAKPKVIEAKRTAAPGSVGPEDRSAEGRRRQAGPEAVRLRCAGPGRRPCAISASQVAGSAPIVSSNSFDSRFGAVK